MRSFFPSNLHSQTTPIPDVCFQLHSRHELVPILAALQYLYQQPDTCQQLLQLIANDVNHNSNPQRGRPGLSYWEITVLASVRLGCNLNYDALQDLATEHHTLRQIMGVADDPLDPNKPCPYFWYRIRDNLCLLQPETIKAINRLVVNLGDQLDPEAAQHGRGDAFVVETNIHYPTEANLLADGARKIVDLARRLAKGLGLPGWRQFRALSRRIKQALRHVNRACRSKRANAETGKRLAYRQLYDLTDQIITKAQALLSQVTAASTSVTVIALAKELRTYLDRTTQVQSYSKRRVLEGAKVENSEKIFSMFEPETELVNRGKQPHPIQFGHRIMLLEDNVGFIADYKVLDKSEAEETTAVDMTREAQAACENRLESVSFDRAFDTPENQEELAKIVPVVCIPHRGAKRGKAQAAGASTAFQEARRAHPGVEAVIGVLQRANGLKRCRDRSPRGYARYVGLGILGHNLHILGQVVLRQQAPGCLAGRTKRKRRGVA